MFPVSLLRPMGVRLELESLAKLYYTSSHPYDAPPISQSSPLLDKSGRVSGFIGQARPRRMFPVDMAGFAVGLARLRKAAADRIVKWKTQKRWDTAAAAATAMPYRATQEEEGFLTGIGVR